jgi:hypothetical protein
VIDDDFARAPDVAALEGGELGHKPRIVEQFDPAGIDERQELAVEIRLRLLREFIFDPAGSPLLARLLACVAIARDGGKSI